MTIQHQRWITFGGEPVIGMTPTRQIIISDPPGQTLTAEQQGFVAHAYRLFIDLVATSAAPHAVWEQNFTAPDGMKVSIRSIYGDRRVTVWPKGGKKLTFEVSGIGVALTETGGALIPAYTANNETEPQPLILYAIPTENKTPSGRWRIKRVPKLLGGNKVWTDTTKKHWFSVYAAAPQQISADGWARVFQNIAGNWVNTDWVGGNAPGWYATALFPPPLNRNFGRTVFQKNKTFGVFDEPEFNPPFLAKFPSQTFVVSFEPEYDHVVLCFSPNEAYPEIELLNGAPTEALLSRSARHSVPLPADTVAMETRVLIHPDGDKVALRMYEFTEDSGVDKIAVYSPSTTVDPLDDEIDTEDSGLFTIASMHPIVPDEPPNIPNTAYSFTGNMNIFYVPVFGPVTYQDYDTGQEETITTIVRWDSSWQSSVNGAYARSMTTAPGGYRYSRFSTPDEPGVVSHVFPITTFEASTQYSESKNATEDRQPDYGVWVPDQYATTVSENAYSSNTEATYAFSMETKLKEFQTYRFTTSIAMTHAITVTYKPRGTNWIRDKDITTQSINYEVQYEKTHRELLWADELTDRRIYLEVRITTSGYFSRTWEFVHVDTTVGETPPLGQVAGNTNYTSYIMDEIPNEGNLTRALVAESKGSKITVPLTAGTTSFYRSPTCIAGLRADSKNTGTPSIGAFSSTSWSDDTPPTTTYTTETGSVTYITPVFAGGFRPETQDLTWTTQATTVFNTAREGTPQQTPPGYASREGGFFLNIRRNSTASVDLDPSAWLADGWGARFAMDPITRGTIVQVERSTTAYLGNSVGSPGGWETWIFVFDDKGVRRIQDIVPDLPSNVEIWRQYNLNSLVSI